MKKEIPKFKDLICPLDVARAAKVLNCMRKYIEDFSLFLRLCYLIA